jgi:recombination protein RecA
MTKQSKPEIDPLGDAMASLNKQFGAGTVYEFGSMPRQQVPVIPTGSLSLDAALGIGGFPQGRVTEIYGPEASGKTTLALHALANAQRAGFRVAMVDAEHALDPDYAAALGVDMDTLLLSQPDTGEQALEVVDTLVLAAAASRTLGVIVIDSVAALVPQAEIEGDMGDRHIGLQARLMSQALRKLTPHVSNSQVACIFINQLREKVGVIFGNPETTTGGRALKFYASVRLDARGIETLKEGTNSIGRRTRVKVVKNKLSAPFRTATFDILFGQGINREGELLDLGQSCGVIRKTGSHHYYGEQALGNGRETARATLRSEPALAAAVEADIRKIGLSGLLVSSEPSSARAVPDRSAMTPPDFDPVPQDG